MPDLALIEHIYSGADLYHLHTRVLVVIPVEWAELSAHEVDLLRKIVGSVKCSLEETQVIARLGIDLDQLTAFSLSFILSFGARIAQIAEPYTVVRYNNFNILLADHLAELSSDTVKKERLWSALRLMFSLS